MLWDSEQQGKGGKEVIGELVGSVKQVKRTNEPSGCQGPVCYLLLPTAWLRQEPSCNWLGVKEVLMKRLPPLTGPLEQLNLVLPQTHSGQPILPSLAHTSFPLPWLIPFRGLVASKQVIFHPSFKF